MYWMLGHGRKKPGKVLEPCHDYQDMEMLRDSDATYVFLDALSRDSTSWRASPRRLYAVFRCSNQKPIPAFAGNIDVKLVVPEEVTKKNLGTKSKHPIKSWGDVD